MNAITQFNQLKDTLRVSALPEMKMAALTIHPSPRNLSLDQVQKVFNQFDPDSGWVLYRDALSTDMIDFSRQDIIEGEWCKPGHSLRLRQIGPNQYHLTECSQVDGETEAYQDVKICLQPISGQTFAIYRIWWRCESKGPRQGRWEPFYQQFIGFESGE
ncbi:hypothetical protein [Vibrio sinaloensis]|uniref:hypothetical protein n=1 Tax=Photobacterium sp. (strain ATCC 43367) TaxID=379097 RepID=UPI0035E583AE